MLTVILTSLLTAALIAIISLWHYIIILKEVIKCQENIMDNIKEWIERVDPD
jgi:hypothetical protein